MNESKKRIASLSEPVNPTPEELSRFWENIAKAGPNDCWMWVGCKIRDGYGRYWFQGKMRGAHRFSWALHNGPISDDLCVLHNCPNGDNPSCVNPAHLWKGTSIENTQDRNQKGRTCKGENHIFVKHPELHPNGVNHPLAKLDPSKVRDIRIRRGRGEWLKCIAEDYGVSTHAIYAIDKGLTWKHVK